MTSPVSFRSVRSERGLSQAFHFLLVAQAETHCSGLADETEGLVQSRYGSFIDATDVCHAVSPTQDLEQPAQVKPDMSHKLTQTSARSRQMIDREVQAIISTKCSHIETQTSWQPVLTSLVRERQRPARISRQLVHRALIRAHQKRLKLRVSDC